MDLKPKSKSADGASFLVDRRTQTVHKLASAQPACRIDDIAPDDRTYYTDEITATTVIKAKHLVPCLHCYSFGRFGKTAPK